MARISGDARKKELLSAAVDEAAKRLSFGKTQTKPIEKDNSLEDANKEPAAPIEPAAPVEHQEQSQPTTPASQPIQTAAQQQNESETQNGNQRASRSDAQSRNVGRSEYVEKTTRRYDQGGATAKAEYIEDDDDNDVNILNKRDLFSMASATQKATKEGMIEGIKTAFGIEEEETPEPQKTPSEYATRKAHGKRTSPYKSNRIRKGLREIAQKAGISPGVFKEDRSDPIGMDVVNELPSDPFDAVASAVSDSISEEMKSKDITGDSTRDKLNGDKYLWMDEVSVGIDIIIAMLRVPGSKLYGILNSYHQQENNGEQLDVEANNIKDLIKEYINTDRLDKESKPPIIVGTYKAPVNEGGSEQQRILRVHDGRGIRINPVMSKSYNADFDGDEMSVVFDQDIARSMPTVMESFFYAGTRNPSIDPKFFPTMYLDDSDARNTMIELMSRYKIPKTIIDAFMDVLENGTELNWAIYLSALTKESGRNSVLASFWFYQMYNVARRISVARSMIVGTTSEISEDLSSPDYMKQEPYYSKREPNMSEDDASACEFITKIASDVINEGKYPMNAQAAYVALGEHLGTAGGGVDPETGRRKKPVNVRFRITSHIAKLIKYNGNVIISEENFGDMYECLMRYAVAKRISGFESVGQINAYIGNLVAEEVRATLGMPSKYLKPYKNAKGEIVHNGGIEGFFYFLKRFVSVYNYWADIAYVANSQLRTNLEYSEGNNYLQRISDSTISNIVRPFCKVYGDFQMRTLFNGVAKHAKLPFQNTTRYKALKDACSSNMTLREFIANNTLEARYSKNFNKNIRDEEIDDETFLYFIEAIADKRSARASKYNKTLHTTVDKYGRATDGYLKKAFDGLKELRRMLEDEDFRSDDWFRFAEQTIDCIRRGFPHVFHNLGINDPQFFVKSKYGQLMLRARTEDELDGIIMSMINESNFESIRLANQQFEDAKDDEYPDEQVAAGVLSRLSARVEGAVARLQSSSVVNRVIVKEMYNGNAWKNLSTISDGVPVRIINDNDPLSISAKVRNGVTVRVGKEDMMFMSVEAAFIAQLVGEEKAKYFQYGITRNRITGKIEPQTSNVTYLSHAKIVMILEIIGEKDNVLAKMASDSNKEVVPALERATKARFENDEKSLKILNKTDDALLIYDSDFYSARVGAKYGAGYNTNQYGLILNRIRDGVEHSINTEELRNVDKSKLYARYYFATPEYRHASLKDMLDDPTVPGKAKQAILHDVVMWYEKNDNISYWEMEYLMLQNPDPRYSIWFDSEEDGTLDMLDASIDEFNRSAKKSFERSKDNIEDAYKTYGKQEGALETVLKAYVDDPSLATEVDDTLFADAIAALLDPQFKLSEKATNMAATNAMYSGIAYRENGGFYSDLYRSDDRAIGIVHKKDVTRLDLIMILSDKNEALYVYGDESKKVVKITRDTLVGKKNSTEMDVWEFLRRNPSLGMAIRMHTVSTISNTKGTSFLTAPKSLTDSIGEIIEMEDLGILDRTKDFHNVKSYLQNEYCFHALSGLIVPIHNVTSRIARTSYLVSERYVMRKIIEIVKLRADGKEIHVPTYIKNNFGIDREKLNELGIDPLVTESLIEDVDAFINRAVDEIDGYLNGDKSRIRGVEITIGTEANVQPQIDEESISLYFDVMQSFSGARVQVQTGVEGSETKEIAPWFSLLRPKDKFIDLGMFTEDEIFDVLMQPEGDDTVYLTRLRTNYGPITDRDNLIEMIDRADADGVPLVCEMPWVWDRFKYRISNVIDGYGNPLSSVNSKIIIKRDAGSEMFNIQIRKFGDDGTNKIVKYTKYSDADYAEIVRKVQEAYDSAEAMSEPQQKQDDEMMRRSAAVIELAKILYQADNEMHGEDAATKYTDISDMNDYVNVADAMINIVDGVVTIRSLRQLASAIKHEISLNREALEYGVSAIRSIAERVDQEVGGIVDVSDADSFMYASRLSRAMFMGIRINSDGRFRPTLKQGSSHFWRNFSVAERIKKRLKDAGEVSYIPDNKTITNFFRENNKRFSKRGDVGAVQEICKNLGYTYTGMLGDAKQYDKLKFSSKDKKYVDFVPAIGPKYAVSIDATKKDNREVVEAAVNYAEMRGLNLILHMSSLDLLPDNKKKIAQAVDDTYYIIPFFDVELNGSEANPQEAQLGSIVCDPDQIIFGYEDDDNQFGLGDAQIQIFDYLTERMDFRKSDVETIGISEIFGDALTTEYGTKLTNYKVEAMTKDDIERMVVNGNVEIDGSYNPYYAVGAKAATERLYRKVERYIYRWKETDENGWMTTGEPGDIIGWVRLSYSTSTGNGKQKAKRFAIAPVIMFPEEKLTNVPSSFEITGYDFGVPGKSEDDFVTDFSTISIRYKYNGGKDGHMIKFHAPGGGADKGMVSLDDSIAGPTMETGRPFDMCWATPSTKSRHGGSGKRQLTFKTMMFVARMNPFGYNFARLDESFPNDPELKDEFKMERFEMERWIDLVPKIRDGSLKLHSDNNMNAWLRDQVTRCMMLGINPSDFLACEFNGMMTNIWYEFEGLFRNDFHYMDNYLKFFHSMMPQLCPDGIDGDSSNCVFSICGAENYTKDQFERVWSSGYDFGHLQMRILRRDENGNVYPKWGTVYAGFGFAGEDFTGFTRPTVRAASKFMDATNVLALLGKDISDGDMLRLIKWGLTDKSILETSDHIEFRFKNDD